MAGRFVRRYQELEVYQAAFEEAMHIFEVSKAFPVEERYSLTDQIRRSSRSICANLAEAWRKRCYAAAFVAKLTDCAAEAAETQTWIAFAVRCEYLSPEVGQTLTETYDKISGMVVTMNRNSQKWTTPKP